MLSNITFRYGVREILTSLTNMFVAAQKSMFGVLLCMIEYSVHFSLLKKTVAWAIYYDMIHEYLLPPV